MFKRSNKDSVKRDSFHNEAEIKKEERAVEIWANAKASVHAEIAIYARNGQERGILHS